MGKTIKPLSSAPELPEEVTGPIAPEEVLELNDKVDGPLDEKLAELLEETPEEPVAEPTPADEPKPTEEQPAPADTPDTPDTDNLEADGLPDDAETERYIDEIVAEEGDAVLAAEDRKRAAQEHTVRAHKRPSRLASLLRSIWSDPRQRWIALGLSTAIVLALALIPYSRYFILNSARVRAGLSLRVIDAGTRQPLKNVTVRAGGAQAQTDSDGTVKLTGVRLGRTKLQIEKRAFAPVEQAITVGWGSNPLGEYEARAVGTQYTFFVRDAFSGQALAGAEAASGDGNAISDEEGKVVLVLDTANQPDEAQLSISVTAEDYRTETLNLTVNNKETGEVRMVPSRRHVFVSKRSGGFDVYAIDADGKNEERVVGGSGQERSDIALVPHPTQNVAAFVATRENTRNQHGYLLSTLYILDTTTGDLVKIDQSEQIKLVGWTDNGRLVYVKIAAGASGTDPKRHRLMSFNNNDYADVKELASSNTFNDVVMAGGRVYYAPSNIFQETTPALHAVNPDGSNPQTILDREVYAIVRGGYDLLYLNAGTDWYGLTLGAPQAAKVQAPGSQLSRVYMDAPGGKYSLWVDERDGKGVLIRYDKTSGEEKVLTERGGLRLPVYWLNDKYVVYRVADGRETADYIMNLDGGEPRKIVDVTATDGISRWIYY